MTTERRSRAIAWSLSFVAYATYYLGRKTFGVVKKPVESELGLGVGALSAIDMALLIPYTVGQFVSGVLGDRLGARKLVGFGMLASALACALFGSASGLLLMLLCFVVNGFAQSTGWPGTTRTMAEFTTPAERGTVMGFWSTCYQIGGIAATWIAGEVAQRYGWRASLYVAAVGLFGVGLLVLGFLPERSAEKAREGVPVQPDTAAVDAEQRLESERRAAQRAVVRNPRLWCYGISYFFIKLIRYALLLWLPYYLATWFGSDTSEAARFSIPFEAGGALGVVLIGYLSDRLPWRGRAVWAFVWLLALTLALVAYVALGQASRLYHLVLLALVGALLFGPDALLSGAAAQDAGGTHAPAMATGFVNGVGSLGAVAQGFLIPALAANYGWPSVFRVFVAFAVCAALILIPTVWTRTLDPPRSGA
jgi:sugar phosphate permease